MSIDMNFDKSYNNSFTELSQDTQDQWNELLSNSLAETNQRNLCSSFVSHLHRVFFQ